MEEDRFHLAWGYFLRLIPKFISTIYDIAGMGVDVILVWPISSAHRFLINEGFRGTLDRETRIFIGL